MDTDSNKLFYQNLKCFLKDLNSVFSDDEDIKIITSSINIYSMDDDENKIIKMFYKSLLPLEKIIKNRDNNFFYMDHSNYWNKTSYQYQLFNKLNFYWEHLDEINKKIVWDYLIVIYNLSKDFCTK